MNKRVPGCKACKPNRSSNQSLKTLKGLPKVQENGLALKICSSFGEKSEEVFNKSITGVCASSLVSKFAELTEQTPTPVVVSDGK